MHTNSRDVCALYPTTIKRNNLAKDLKIPFLRYRLNIYPHKRVIKSNFVRIHEYAQRHVLLGNHSILHDTQLCTYPLLNIWINLRRFIAVQNRFTPKNILFCFFNNSLFTNTPLVSTNVFFYMWRKAFEPHAFIHIMRVFHVMY